MTNAPIILVPGFWLGAWAWDEVAALLRANGHDVTPLTLPGLDAVDTDRSAISFDDHVGAIRDAVTAAAAPVVLAVHSGAGMTGYAATDAVHEHLAHVVYVDCAPGKGAMNADQSEDLPLAPRDQLAEEENLDGISEEQLARFYERAVPQPAGVIRGQHEFTQDARLDVPSTVFATAYTPEEYRTYADEGYGWLAGLKELRQLSWVGHPTSHWPMWSAPAELARVIGDRAANPTGDR